MCYSIYLSTDCPDDLESKRFTHLNFESDLAPEQPQKALLAHLEYPRRWYMNRAEYGGCSCHFRHSIDLTFEPPQDWLPEDDDNVSATKEAHGVFLRMVDAGYHVDVIDAFSSQDCLDGVRKLTVSMGTVSAESFRFFEGYRFDLEA